MHIHSTFITKIETIDHIEANKFGKAHRNRYTQAPKYLKAPLGSDKITLFETVVSLTIPVTFRSLFLSKVLVLGLF